MASGDSQDGNLPLLQIKYRRCSTGLQAAFFWLRFVLMPVAAMTIRQPPTPPALAYASRSVFSQ
jgi:hypothetical protein